MAKKKFKSYFDKSYYYTPENLYDVWVKIALMLFFIAFLSLSSINIHYFWLNIIGSHLNIYLA